MGVRPSNLLSIENPLVAYLLDKGTFDWGTFVETKMAEAEARVRQAFKNRKGSEVFINSERIKAYNRLLGINDPTAGYRLYSLPKPKLDKPIQQKTPTHDMSQFSS